MNGAVDVLFGVYFSLFVCLSFYKNVAKMCNEGRVLLISYVYMERTAFFKHCIDPQFCSMMPISYGWGAVSSFLKNTYSFLNARDQSNA